VLKGGGGKAGLDCSCEGLSLSGPVGVSPNVIRKKGTG